MTQRKSLNDWLSYLESMHPTEIDLGLDRIKQVSDKLQLEPLADQVITVAGTNGKGTSCAFLEAYSQGIDKQVGLYTSPHLIRFNERVRINGQEASDQQLLSAFEVIEAARGDTSLTYFEFTTLAAMWLFKQAMLDVVILEVGLGGRLDAVNIIDPDLALVTSISVDHEAWLGRDIEAIGREKAGIFRAHKPAVFGAEGKPQSVGDYASDIGAQFYQAGRDYQLIASESHWQWQACGDDCSNGQSFEDLIHPSFPVQNVATCIMGLSQLGWLLTAERINWAIEHAFIRGRMEPFNHQGVEGWLDVAHNPESAKHLARQLKEKTAPGQNNVAVFGAMSDKDINGVIDELKDVISHWLCIDLPIDRAISSAELKEMLQAKGMSAEQFATFESAFNTIKSATDFSVQETTADNLVVLGSFFTVAEAIIYFDKQ